MALCCPIWRFFREQCIPGVRRPAGAARGDLGAGSMDRIGLLTLGKSIVIGFFGGAKENEKSAQWLETTNSTDRANISKLNN